MVMRRKVLAAAAVPFAGALGLLVRELLSPVKPTPAMSEKPAPQPGSHAMQSGEIAPSDSRVEAGRVHEARGELADAEAAYRQAIDQNPKSTAAYLGLARVLRFQSPTLSAEMIDRALELEPNNAQAYVESAITNSRMLRFERATQDAEIALDLDPRGASAAQAHELLAAIAKLQRNQ